MPPSFNEVGSSLSFGGLCLSGALESYCVLDMFYLLIWIHSPPFPALGPGYSTYVDSIGLRPQFRRDQRETLAGDSRGGWEETEAKVSVPLVPCLLGCSVQAVKISSPARQLSASHYSLGVLETYSAPGPFMGANDFPLCKPRSTPPPLTALPKSDSHYCTQSY